jgi:hypothetical protein
VAHLADNWPKDRNSRGYLSILDRNLEVISNVGGTPPTKDASGALRRMRNDTDAFLHPHDALTNPDGSLVVAQFASGRTYPVRLERV